MGDELQSADISLRSKRAVNEPGLTKTEAQRANARRYYEKNKERLRAEGRAKYHASTPEQKERHRQNSRSYYERHRSSVISYNSTARRRSVLASYGLTQESYEKLWELQQGLCAICKSRKRLDVEWFWR